MRRALPCGATWALGCTCSRTSPRRRLPPSPRSTPARRTCSSRTSASRRGCSTPWRTARWATGTRQSGAPRRRWRSPKPDGRVALYLTIPGTLDLLRDHPTHRTAHGAHLQVLCDVLGGVEPEPSAPSPGTLREPLKERELAVLRFLSTNLTAAEIGNELILSVHTVKTHMRKLYAKLEVHTRAEAVQQGRALGLLAPARRSH